MSLLFYFSIYWLNRKSIIFDRLGEGSGVFGSSNGWCVFSLFC